MTDGHRLSDRYAITEGALHLTGIQALARVPIDQRRADDRLGRRTAAYISGYEGSPLAGYDLELARQQALLDAHDIVFQPAVNEELAATAVQGTQLAATMSDCRVEGITGYWYGKSPGLDRSSDALRHNNLGGTHPAGGAVAFVGDDPAAKSSTVPGSSEQLLADLGIPTLYPADPQDVVDLGLHSVALSRASGLWVALKIATAVADGAGPVEVSPRRVEPVAPQLNGAPYRHEVTGKLLQPNLTRLERSRNGVRLEIARSYARLNGLNRITRGAADRIGVVAAGKTYLDMRQALRTLGLDDEQLAQRGIRLLRLGMIYPIEPTIVQRFADGLDEVIVVEEKRAFIELAIKDLLYGRPRAPQITGKRNIDGTALLPDDGELDVDIIAHAVATRLGSYEGFTSIQAGTRRPHRPTALPLAIRSPYFCSGCPHNSSTKSPDGSLVGAGIGCHGLVVGMRPQLVGEVTGLTQMGGEGAQWIGMEPFLGRQHLLQNLGDGTFHHSASLAVRAAVAAGANITYKLLYNSTVAMTGGQDAVGQMSIPRLCAAMLAEGVREIIVTTDDTGSYRGRRMPKAARVWPRDRLDEAQRHLASVPGVTMLIHDQECATELRRKRKRGLAPDPPMRILINERICEGCGDCGVKSNCLSVQPVETEFGRKTRIDQSSCNKDYSCLAGDCPSFVSVIPRGKVRQAKPALQPLPLEALPEPEPIVSSEIHTIRILGIGGSGVVTLSQIFGVAASRAGRHVVTLDQTGIAQKGGAVVSDVKTMTTPIDSANRAADGEADLYLGADLLVAADPKNLRAADPVRTVAVISTSIVPTGNMVTDTAETYPDIDQLTGQIAAATRSVSMTQLDARGLAQTLFSSDQFANLLLAGVAYQVGALPISARAIEDAIAINGVAVDANVQAFRRGRQFVADRHALDDAVNQRLSTRPNPKISNGAADLISSVGAAPGSELHRLVSIRIPDLIDYQDVRYANRYAQVVADVARVESQVTPQSSAISEAVAHHLHKLMAYKDEYEVARLSLDPAFTESVRAEFGADVKVSYRLHPPLLRMLGLRHKISLGAWFRVVYRLLLWLRRLRGTPVDPFGWMPLRRVERRMIKEYVTTIKTLVVELTPDTAAAVAEIAALPDLIRGYEDIKLKNIERYREHLAELRDGLQSPT